MPMVLITRYRPRCDGCRARGREKQTEADAERGAEAEGWRIERVPAGPVSKRYWCRTCVTAREARAAAARDTVPG
jgi:hypothetical protein